MRLSERLLVLPSGQVVKDGDRRVRYAQTAGKGDAEFSVGLDSQEECYPHNYNVTDTLVPPPMCFGLSLHFFHPH